MNSDSLNMVSRLGEGHMPWTFFLSEPQLKTTVREYTRLLGTWEYRFSKCSSRICQLYTYLYNDWQTHRAGILSKPVRALLDLLNMVFIYKYNLRK